MSSFLKDLRIDTLAIGLLQSIAWYLTYPIFLMLLHAAGVFQRAFELPLIVIVAAPMALMMLLLALGSVLLATCVTFIASRFVRKSYNYSLPRSSWSTVLNLGIAYWLLTSVVFALGYFLFTPDFAMSSGDKSLTNLAQEHGSNDSLSPFGSHVVNALLSFLNAYVTYSILRTNNRAKTPTAP